ncbi:MAG: DinB family protein [Verrucomicrobiota bacterium]
MSAQPQLAPPGAGLPKPEALIIRYLAFPLLRLKLTPKECFKLFAESGHELLSLSQDLSLQQLTTPILVKRLPGMEDSSRNWSMEETLEHIQIVSAGALYIISKLEKGQKPAVEVRTQDVKPNGGLGLDRVRAFRDYLADLPNRLQPLTYSSKTTHHHPWFGPLPSLDWLRLLAFHQDLHRKQARLIARELKKT